MLTLTWITEKELKPEIKKQRRRISLKEQHENYVVALIKWETLATSKVKMSGSKEKRKLRRKLFVNTYDISSMKRVTRKFQRRQRNVEESMLHVQSLSVPSPLHCMIFDKYIHYNISHTWHFSLCKNGSRLICLQILFPVNQLVLPLYQMLSTELKNFFTVVSSLFI